MQDKICGHASTVIHQPTRSSDFLTQPSHRVSPKAWIATIVMSLGLAGGLWLMTAANLTQIAQAETASVDLTIDSRPNETYENLIKRAEAAARAAVTQSFNQNKEATDASITVVARNQGEIAPVLSLNVSRNEWSSSNAQRGITYFTQARSLLGFDEDVATTTPDRQRGNTNSIRNRQPRNTYTPTRQPNSTRQGTFTQPGRPVTPSTTGEPSEDNAPGQFGTGNPTNTPQGTGQTSPSIAPTNPSGQQQNSNPASPPAGAGLAPQPPVIPSVNQPSQQQNFTPPAGSSLTPLPPVIPSANPSSPTSNPSSSSTPFNPSGTYTEPQDQYR